MKGEVKVITIIVVIAIVIVAILACCKICIRNFGENDSKNENVATMNVQENNVITNNGNEMISDKVDIVPTMEDKISSDSVWCPTFQLVWNDMKNEVVGQDIHFIEEEEPEYLENLNKELFKEDQISEEYYYKKWGIKSNDLKEELISEIKDKFNENSDVIDENEDWDAWKNESDAEKKYIFYTMLKKVFNFETPFDVLDDGIFYSEGMDFGDVKYFGIDEDSKEALREQVNILYFNNVNDFAISVNTKENDEVIFAKGTTGENFAQKYENIKNSAENYSGDIKLGDEDTLKIPNLKFYSVNEYEELLRKEFFSNRGTTCEINQAIQTIQFEMNNEGGKLKSEALIEMTEKASLMEDTAKILDFDREFVIFVKEKDKEIPYFALNVSDISKFQEDALQLIE